MTCIQMYVDHLHVCFLLLFHLFVFVFVFLLYFLNPYMPFGISQVAKSLVPSIRSVPANGSMKPTYIRFLTGIKAYSQIFSVKEILFFQNISLNGDINTNPFSFLSCFTMYSKLHNTCMKIWYH